MSERRMFAKTIIDSDAFLEMPLSAQALYFHLSMRADDEGFLNNAKKIMRVINANQNDYDLLVAKNFIIQFPDGICVIKHWRIHNYIQNDRFKPTVYQEERSMLALKGNKSYTLKSDTDTECIQDGYSLETQYSIGKDSIGKVSKEEVREKKPLDFVRAWENTFDLYPKKSAAATAKAKWFAKVGEVIEENREAVATLIYKATKAYLADYDQNNNDAEYRFIPKYDKWLDEDCDYWIRQVEKVKGDTV